MKMRCHGRFCLAIAWRKRLLNAAFVFSKSLEQRRWLAEQMKPRGIAP